MDQSQHVLLGVIENAHGIAGEVRIHAYTDVPCDIASYGALMSQDQQSIQINDVRAIKGDRVIARLNHIETRSQAEALKGVKLYIHRSQLPDLDPETYYQVDLIGMNVQDHNRQHLGQVHGIQNYGASDILEIEMSDKSMTMVPNIPDAVLDINFDDRFMIINTAFMT